MIRVTRLDRQEIAINSDLIESIEARPDTTVRLVGGQSIVVRESLDEILERIAEFRGRVLGRAGLGALLAVRPRDLREPEGLEDLLELDREGTEACTTDVEETA
jgi:flagellar protein FlbD